MNRTVLELAVNLALQERSRTIDGPETNRYSSKTKTVRTIFFSRN